MEYSAKSGKLIVTGITDFSLADTLESGQCFRYELLSDGFYKVHSGRRRGEFCEQGETLVCRCVTATEFDSYWRNYFDLDYDYAGVKKLLATDPVMKRCISFCGGIHILRQDMFETLICFIISQNNNIPRIKGIVAALCEQFGEGGFPTPQTLAALEPPDLAGIRAGFRARYIIDAAQKVLRGEVNLAALSDMSYPEAEAELLKICGVGCKVAACALLFGARQLDAFPIDVWIKKALEYFYPHGFDMQIYHGYAGIAQQYLYHYSRVTGLKL